MKRSLLGGFLILIVIGLFALWSSLFTVYQTENALVLRFGEPQRVIINDPGLHWKLPIADAVIFVDNRILDLDSPVQEVIASDQKRLVVDAFARYRITNPLRFYQSAGSINQASSRLAAVLNSAVRRVLGDATFFAVVRDDRPELMALITEQVNREAQSFGINVIDVRIRRADLPQANSEAIYRRMQTERQQEASQIRAEGEEEARRIRSRADRNATVIVAEANRDSEQIRGEGDAERNAIFAEAFNQDPDFFAFYRSMQAYDQALAQQDTRFLLSPSSDFFRYFGSPLGSSARASARSDADLGGQPSGSSVEAGTAGSADTSGEEASGSSSAQ